MEREGKYIYCIIGTGEEKNLGPIGIGGRNDEVTTCCYQDIGMVISNHPFVRLAVNRRNTVAHETVVERVMEEFSVLPVRFCTLATDVEEIRDLLAARYREFKDLLEDMDRRQSAIAAYREFPGQRPGSPWVTEAFFRSGLLLYREEQHEEAGAHR